MSTRSSNQTHSSIASPQIEARGVRVHNLRGIDVDIPLGSLAVISGVSGSGKSSLAFDTLFAEGQRRYLETFSTAVRQTLERFEKPDAERVDHIPPAVALRQNSIVRSDMTTLATMTEVDDLLRLLVARLGRLVCPDCRKAVTAASISDIAEQLMSLKPDRRFQIGFPLHQPSDDAAHSRDGRQQPPSLSGFSRAIMLTADHGRALPLTDALREWASLAATPAASDRNAKAVQATDTIQASDSTSRTCLVVVDRLVSGRVTLERLTESLEIAASGAQGRFVILLETDATDRTTKGSAAGVSDSGPPVRDDTTTKMKDASPRIVCVDDRQWELQRYSSALECGDCGRSFEAPEPELLNFRSVRGACPQCLGRGTVPEIDLARLVREPSKSLRGGALSCFLDPLIAREQKRFLEQAETLGIPLDVPFQSLTSDQRISLLSGTVSTSGAASGEWAGLRGLFQRIERQRRPAAQRFLQKWGPPTACPVCEGSRLRPEARAIVLTLPEPSASTLQFDFTQLVQLTALELRPQLDRLAAQLSPLEQRIAAALLPELHERLRSLEQVGLGTLPLNRSLRTLSRGEAQRAAITAILSARLVEALFIFDEPSTGLHASDSARVIELLKQLREAGNTVLIVEHEREYLSAADWILDIGPGAGRDGGTVVYCGPANAFDANQCPNSATARHLSRSENESPLKEAEWNRESEAPAEPPSPRLTLSGCRHLNLHDITLDIPLECLCVVSGVSGSGKTALIEQTLYPALCAALNQECEIAAGAFDRLAGAERLRSAQLVDDSPLSGSHRSSPITWLKAFDDIRQLFAETHEAQSRNLTPAHFSFNTDSGGRCSKCEGAGQVVIDMQFMADVRMTCPDCHGTRYQRHILEINWRGRSIADVLSMTAAEAFAFFRGEPRIQKRLQSLREVGLEYLTLGQPLATLSGGEAQRLKLAACLSTAARDGSLLILDEPTTGLHPADVQRLLSCFERLLSVGHSLLVIEHQLDVIRAADHVIDLGPGAGVDGGRIVATGTPADIVQCAASLTGRALHAAFR